jgi:hypothetical protein
MVGAQKGPGSKEGGIDLVRWALGEGLINFLRPEQRMRPVHRKHDETGEWQVVPWPDSGIHDRGKPTSCTAEIPGYIYIESETATTDDARAKREKSENVDPKCADHGCDMIRYFARHFFGDRRPQVTLPDAPVSPAPENSWGQHMRQRGWLDKPPKEWTDGA